VRERPAGPVRRTILVVAGDETGRAVLVSLLCGQPDLAAAGVATVEEALWFLRGIRVHLLLLDVRPAEADGLALIRRLRSDPAPWGIPLIALAPTPIPYSEQTARLAGCAAVLADPADPEALVEAVRTVLDDRAIRR
jgi:CheY-like chemotaxis protein